MPSIQELEQALIAADKAGDKEAAMAIATDIEKLATAPEQKQPGLLDVIAGKNSLGEFASGRVEALKAGVKEFSPSNLKKELTSFPPITEETTKQMEDTSLNMVLSSMPVTKLGTAAKSFIKPSVGAELVKQQTLKNAGKAGYYVPAQQVQPGKLADLGERFAGKQGIEATARGLNQPITNKLANKALGLADDVPITKELLQGIRAVENKAYDAAANIGTLKANKAYFTALRDIQKEYAAAAKDFPGLASQEIPRMVKALAKKEISSKGAVAQVKLLRRAATEAFRKGETELGKARQEAANALDDLIESNIAPALGKQIAGAYKSARVKIAKTHVIERALNESTGNVVATEIVKQGKKSFLTGELKEIAEFAKAFPKAAAEPLSGPPTGGLLESMAFAAAGKHMAGSKIGALAGITPLVGKPLARKMMVNIPETVGRPLLGTKTEFLQRSILGKGGFSLERNKNGR